MRVSNLDSAAAGSGRPRPVLPSPEKADGERAIQRNYR
jgi:hypothetical protein